MQCEVHWLAGIKYLDSEGTRVDRREQLGDFDNKTDAIYAMAEAGLTRDQWGYWSSPYCQGYITRVLKEIKNV